VQIIVDDWSRFQPLRTGLAVATELQRLYPGTWNAERYDVLLGHRVTWEGVKRALAWEEIEKAWQADLQAFRERRRNYLLYSE
jgi:uncharacterized protein YbbC (DUF1343 family)